MNRLKVQITDSAFEQFQEQVEYIARDSIDNALEWETRLRAAIQDLADFHGHAIDEDAGDRIGGVSRKLVF